MGANQEVRAFQNFGMKDQSFLQEGYSFRKINEKLMTLNSYLEHFKKESHPGMFVIKDGRRNPPDSTTPVADT